MNDNDIQEFINAFEDFMKHSELQELYYDGIETYRKHSQDIRSDIEQKAAELEVTCDYYIMEFM